MDGDVISEAAWPPAKLNNLRDKLHWEVAMLHHGPDYLDLSLPFLSSCGGIEHFQTACSSIIGGVVSKRRLCACGGGELSRLTVA